MFDELDDDGDDILNEDETNKMARQIMIDATEEQIDEAVQDALDIYGNAWAGGDEIGHTST
jgi:hypothetical protein